MNAEALFTRAAAAALPENSKERALATAALRRLWHAVFDPCPELARLYGDKNREFLDPFLEHAARRKLSMRWTLHAHLLLWMRENLPAALSPATTQELLAAAAARWANEDQSDARGLLLYDAASPGSGLAAWKLKSVSRDIRVVLIDFPAPKLTSPGISCAPFADERYPDAPSWRPIPD
jgi:hypothetical protein